MKIEIQLTSVKARLLIAFFAAMPFFAHADAWSTGQLMVYPAQGQSADQMSKDRYECHLWAVQQSGFDPSRAQPAPPPTTSNSSGVGREVLRGGLRGAAGGAAIGAIAGDAGKGAAIGATAGALKRGVNQYDSNKSAPPPSAADQGYGNYQRALAACLGGRGYNVN